MGKALLAEAGQAALYPDDWYNLLFIPTTLHHYILDASTDGMVCGSEMGGFYIRNEFFKSRFLPEKRIP
jgi:hypothetical protein